MPTDTLASRPVSRAIAGLSTALLLRALVPAATAAVITSALLCTRAQAGDRAYVSNERAGTVSVIDVQSDRVIETVSIGGRPRGIAATADGRSLFVALSHGRDGADSTAEGIARLDTATLRVTGLAPVGNDPEGFAVGERPPRLYAANEDAGTASVTDLASGKPLQTLVVGIEPEGVAISPDERFVYVTAEASNTISVIDTRKQEVVAIFRVDPRPRAAAFSRDGALAFVTSEAGRAVSVIDGGRHAVIGRLCFERPEQRPVGVAVTRDAHTLFVATGRANTVAVIDVSDPHHPRLTQEIAVGARPWGVALDASQRKLYTANGLSNDVSVIDTRSLKVLATIPAGDGPWGVAIAPAPTRHAGLR
jgi:PQQ-dependent catabolism-associated beta-propeller protein